MQIARDYYLEKLKRKEGNGLVKVITGLRRCGKSYLLFRLFRNWLREKGIKDSQVLEIALDQLESQELLDPHALLDHIKGRIKGQSSSYVLLDEVQMVKDFEALLSSLMHVPGCDVYVTGSNSKFLSKDIITAFRGRGDEVRLRPLTFAEFFAAKGGREKEAWIEYSTYGGLPHVASLSSEEDKTEYLQKLFHEVYLRDIKERLALRHPIEMDEILDLLASNTGSLTNPDRIARTMKSVHGNKIAPATVNRYLEQLENAFMVSRARRWDVKGQRYVGSPFKWYYEDMGLRNARLSFRQLEENHLMENAIYNELMARGCKVDVGIVEYGTRDAKGQGKKVWLEVDFVVSKGYRRTYVQSAFRMPDREKQDQELRSLERIPDSFQKIVVVADAWRRSYDNKGILTVGLVDFLLDKNILNG